MSCFYTDVYRCLEMLVGCRKDGPEHTVVLKTGTGDEKQCEAAGHGYYRWLRFEVETDTEYEVDLKGCDAPLIYLSGSDDILDRGIRYLEMTKDDRYLEESRRKDGIYRERYHFTPYRNWVNDPNGLCYFKGHYHMYYQYNPFSQRWGNMYWGHAASRDLLHWKDLPVSLEPQRELLESPEKMGGAFSGAAVPVKDEKIIFYFTRHLGEKKEAVQSCEVQTMTESEDSILFGPERTVAERPDASFSNHFRDPKVEQWEDGLWYMVVGSCVDGIPAVPYYRSEDMENWEYQGILLEENGIPGIETVECPDAFRMGDQMVMVASMMRFASEPVETQHVRYYVGRWEHGRMKVSFTDILDFGGNLYAAQTFLCGGRRIMIGWVADFWQEHIEEEGGCCGSMTIPRIVELQNGRLCVRPEEAVYSLKKERLYEGNGESIHMEAIPGNAWYARLEFGMETEFDMCLMKGKSSSLHITYRQGVIKLATENGSIARPDGGAELEKIRELEIFVDRRMVEVFVNGGERTGTRVFYGDGDNGIFSAEFSRPEAVAMAEVSAMESIWSR